MKDDEGRYILIDIEMLNTGMTIANIYAPSSDDQPESFEKVIREVVLLDNESIVIGADCNLALNPNIASNHPTNIYHARSRKQIHDIMNTYDLVDVYRNLLLI